jgi:simple sugar transport system ATP-binding protein
VGAFGRLDLDAARATASAVAREMGILIPWDVPAAQLGVGDRQRLAIVRTLSRDAHVILLDEPTAVLTPGEANALYAALRRLADQGRAVVVATHRLVEVREHADVVSVLRRGKLASTRSLRSGDGDLHTAIMREVMGEEPPPEVDRPLHHLGEVRLDVRSLRCGKALDGVTMTVRAGEIVGIAGVEGNGQRELVRVLSGLQTPDSGEFWAEAVVVVHEDRQADGLVLDASVRDNLVLGELAHFTRFGLVDQAAVEREARSRLDRAQVIPADLDAQVRTLSGGNQQKIVVARAVARARDASVLVCAQPTRGVDSGAARAIHTEIARQADAGKAIMLVSADLSELRSLSDRILVMARGRIVIEVPPDAPDAVIGEAMLGRSPQEVVA